MLTEPLDGDRFQMLDKVVLFIRIMHRYYPGISRIAPVSRLHNHGVLLREARK